MADEADEIEEELKNIDVVEPVIKSRNDNSFLEPFAEISGST